MLDTDITNFGGLVTCNPPPSILCCLIVPNHSVTLKLDVLKLNVFVGRTDML